LAVLEAYGKNFEENDMFISRECDYAVRILRQLADGTKKTAEVICKQEIIPPQFIYKILKKLEKHGFIRAFRGARGGYTLIKDPAAFSLYDVFTAMDEQVVLTACLQKDFDCPMDRENLRCGVHTEYVRLQALLLAGMKEKTIWDLLH
jgi:Rrf2 family protein